MADDDVKDPPVDDVQDPPASSDQADGASEEPTPEAPAPEGY